MVLRYIPNGVSKFIDPGSEAKRRDASLVSKQPSDMSDTHTPRKRKLEELIDLNDGFCQTPPSAKKPRKNYTLDYKLRIVEASKNSVSQRNESQLIVAEDHHDELFLIDE